MPYPKRSAGRLAALPDRHFHVEPLHLAPQGGWMDPHFLGRGLAIPGVADLALVDDCPLDGHQRPVFGQWFGVRRLEVPT